MQKIKIISVGKNKENWLEEALAEYVKRLMTTVKIEFLWVNDNTQLVKSIEKEGLVICLDANGEMMDSEEFATNLHQLILQGGSRLAFAIGGAEGLPKHVKEKYPLISLSKMTLTHQCTRLILLEQIYRSYEIAKGSKYHK